MRDAFHDELDSLTEHLVRMAATVATALGDATEALLSADLVLAERVIAGDARVDRDRHSYDQWALGLIARQAPVATDLRLVVAGLRISDDLERMGDFASHVAKLARLRYPQAAVVEPLRPAVESMSQVAVALARKAARVVADRNVALALELEREDDEIDELHRTLMTTLVGPGWSHGVEPAVDAALCGRYYERFADHAVSVARRVVFQVTGEYASPADAHLR